jgi:hypothetical protein
MRAILRSIKDFLLRNWWLKLASLLLAYALWLVVRGSEGERVFAVPLTVRIPRNMVIVNERRSSVEITAQGSILPGSRTWRTSSICSRAARVSRQFL